MVRSRGQAVNSSITSNMGASSTHDAKLSLPIWKSSYQDDAVKKDQESLIAAADKSLNVMLSRPETADYSRLSNQLQQQLQQVLLDSVPAVRSCTECTATPRWHGCCLW